MKIVKYKKIRNKYRVYLDNEETIDLYENIILKYDLLIKKEIKDIKSIKKDNYKEEVYELSLNYINKKMRTTKEIKSYLLKKDFSKDIIEETINKLKKLNLLNDELYIRSYINDKLNLSNDGPYKISNYLIHNDMDESLVFKYIDNIDKKYLKEKLENLVEKKSKTIKNCSGNVKKFKIINYFINLGYDKYMIEDVISNMDFNTDNGEKEYNKLYNKYSKKYTGYELENIIRQKLFQKGFDYNEIKKSID